MNGLPGWSRRLRHSLILGLCLGLGPGVVVSIFFAATNMLPAIARPMRSTPGSEGLLYQELTARSFDGVVLKGWYIPPPSPGPGPAVLLCHGHKSSRDDFIKEARFLHDGGFGVVMPNLRQHGDSGHGFITFGINEARDCQAFVNFLAQHPWHRDQPLGAMGYSMGAVTVLRLALLDERIKAVVADSPFASLADQCFHRVEAKVPFMASYFWCFTLGAGCILTGNAPGEWDVGSWIRTMKPRPIFLIHGLADTNIPPDASRILSPLLPAGGQTWFVEKARHVEARKLVRPEYGRRVTEFFNRALLAPAAMAAPAR